MEQYLGKFDIEDCMNIDTDNFDRRKFGRRVQCECGNKMNPFYHKSYVESEWTFEWVGCDHKEPVARCEVICPKCESKIHFRLCVPQ